MPQEVYTYVLAEGKVILLKKYSKKHCSRSLAIQCIKYTYNYLLQQIKHSPWSGKNTHISKVSNSVTYLKSYTNTTIANISRISTLGADITTPSTDIATASAISACHVPISLCRAEYQYHLIKRRCHRIEH